MKIAHLCLANFYSDGFSYQENEITKFHKALGHEVAIIASTDCFDKSGTFTTYTGEPFYNNEHGIPVTRLQYKNPSRVYRKLRRYQGLTKALEGFQADILFIHGCQFLDASTVVKYIKKHPNVTVFVDNHADYNNSAHGFLSKKILHGVIWKHAAHKLIPYTKRFYGVLPARVDFLQDAYGIPAKQCALLVMGADDNIVAAAREPQVREQRRREYGFGDDDIVIVTGGKIDHNKPQVLKLMKAVRNYPDSRVKLAVFGSVMPKLKEEFDSYLDDRIVYIGWRAPSDIYTDFAAADLVAFPGLHSVLWEEAVGMGKPCVFKRIEGCNHIDLNGNCLFFENDTENEYQEVIRTALDNLQAMRLVAEKKGLETFSYKAIAKRSIE